MKSKDFVEMFSRGFLKRIHRLEKRNEHLEANNQAQLAIIRAFKLEKPNHIHQGNIWMFEGNCMNQLIAFHLNTKEKETQRMLNELGWFKK
jgi:hypothetical protein